MSKVSKFTESYIIRKIDKETVNIQILDNDALMAIVGEFNNNLLELEKLTNTNIFFRCDDASLKQALNLKDSSDQEIFSKLRDLKDSF